MELASKDLCGLSYYYDIKNAFEVLNNSTDENLLKEVHNHIQQHIQEKIAEIKQRPPYELFQPSLQKNLTKLENVESIQIFLQAINRYKEICKKSINTIEEIKTSILNGTKKKELSNDWLGSISQRVNLFLVQQ